MQFNSTTSLTRILLNAVFVIKMSRNGAELKGCDKTSVFTIVSTTTPYLGNFSNYHLEMSSGR